MKKFGIDVSLYQKGFNFEKAKAEGVEFAIIKCSQEDYKDPQFENHYKAAKAVGLGVGAYHYLKANTVEGAKKEAEFCVSALKGKQFEYPIYLDFEEGIYQKNTKAENDAIIKAFCDVVEKAGYWVGFYTSYNYYKYYIDGEALAKRYTLWLAAWMKEIPVSSPMWQFGGETNVIRTNKVAGVVCDQNYCFEDFPALIKKAGLNGFKKAEKPALKSTKEIVAEIIAGKWGVGADRKRRLEAAGYNYDTIQSAVNVAMGKVAEHKTIKKGDKVKVIKNIIYGTTKAFTVYYDKYDVLDVDGDRVVIGIGRATTAAVSAKNLLKV